MLDALTADEVIALLQLRPLDDEGGYFTETYRSAYTLDAAALHDRHGGDRTAKTAIYYLVTPEAFSALHRLPGDEVYHFYLGDQLDLTLLHPDGRVETVRLGTDLRAGQRPQAIAPGGVWQGSALAPGGTWALVGTTMTPGFHVEDFELGDLSTLLHEYPHAADIIYRLTRVEP
jgi:predicted cupin superfamily sugar epimerase